MRRKSKKPNFEGDQFDLMEKYIINIGFTIALINEFRDDFLNGLDNLSSAMNKKRKFKKKSK